MQLEQPIQFNEYQKKIELSTEDCLAGKTAMISGWGILKFPSDETPEHLQKTTALILDETKCQEIFKEGLSEEQFCALEKIGVGPCDVSVYNLSLHVMKCKCIEISRGQFLFKNVTVISDSIASIIINECLQYNS